MIREYKVYFQHSIYPHGLVDDSSRIVKAFTAADAIAQTLLHPGLRITKVEPVQEETKQEDGKKCADCIVQSGCQVHATAQSIPCQGPY